jgi:hypothetical protein
MLALARPIDAWPFNQRVKSGAFHSKPSGGSCGSCGQSGSYSWSDSHAPELQKEYIKLVGDETILIVPDEIASPGPAFVEDKATKFRGELKSSLNDNQNSLLYIGQKVQGRIQCSLTPYFLSLFPSLPSTAFKASLTR